MVKKFGNIIDYHITKYERPQSIFDFLDSTLVNANFYVLKSAQLLT